MVVIKHAAMRTRKECVALHVLFAIMCSCPACLPPQHLTGKGFLISCEHMALLLQHPNAVAVEVKAYLYGPEGPDGQSNFYKGAWLSLPSF